MYGSVWSVFKQTCIVLIFYLGFAEATHSDETPVNHRFTQPLQELTSDSAASETCGFHHGQCWPPDSLWTDLYAWHQGSITQIYDREIPHTNTYQTTYIGWDDPTWSFRPPISFLNHKPQWGSGDSIRPRLFHGHPGLVDEQITRQYIINPQLIGIHGATPP